MDALDIIINADITSSTMLRWEQERGYQSRNPWPRPDADCANVLDA